MRGLQYEMTCYRRESHENDPGQKMTLVVKKENDPGFKMDRKMVQVLKGKMTLVSILLGKWSRYSKG